MNDIYLGIPLDFCFVCFRIIFYSSFQIYIWSKILLKHLFSDLRRPDTLFGISVSEQSPQSPETSSSETLNRYSPLKQFGFSKAIYFSEETHSTGNIAAAVFRTSADDLHNTEWPVNANWLLYDDVLEWSIQWGPFPARNGCRALWPQHPNGGGTTGSSLCRRFGKIPGWALGGCFCSNDLEGTFCCSWISCPSVVQMSPAVSQRAANTNSSVSLEFSEDDFRLVKTLKKREQKDKTKSNWSWAAAVTQSTAAVFSGVLKTGLYFTKASIDISGTNAHRVQNRTKKVW